MTRQMRLEKCLKYTDTTDNKFACFIAENKAKISASGQTCGQVRKMGLFNPKNREEQAHYVYCENARFREDLRENKRKSEVRLNLRFWSE